MDLVALAIIIVMQALVLKWVKPAKPQSESPKPSSLDIQVALASALCDVGLNVEDYGLNHNVRFTGKLGDILIHSSRELNIPMETIGDLHDLLLKAKQ